MAPKLPKRKLGKNGPEVDALGFGTMGLSAFYGPTGSDEERFKVLDHVYGSGNTFWDSADIYGDSEDLIGKWFRRTGKRDDIFLATKFANRTKPDGSREIRSDPEYCREAVEKSLKRLGVDTIDLYYCHRVNSQVPIEKTVEAMAELQKAGKIRYIGLSEVSAETLRRACKVHHVDAVQMEYSPFAMEIESPQTGLLAACRELGVAVVAYSPLGRGILSGRYRSPQDFPAGDFRSRLPRYSAENFPNNIKLIDAIVALATEKGCTPGQLTLAWLLAQGDDIIPIPGTSKIKNYDENLGALRVTLSPAENAKIRAAVEKAEIVGGRYPDVMNAALFADTVALEQES